MGGAFHATSQVSKIVTDDPQTFGANYAGAYFIFENQFGKSMSIDSYCVASEFQSRIGAYPLG
jgi:hypothetical protein